MLPKDAKAYLEKIPEDEPVFILRAKDIYSPAAIAAWAGLVQAPIEGKKASGASIRKAQEAMYDAKMFRAWQAVNKNKVKVPD